MVSKEQINYDDPKAARYVKNIEGWIDINGRFFGNNPDSEHMARWSSCTHIKCECGNLVHKGWTKCDDCRFKAKIEKYNNLPYKEYDGGLVYSHAVDEFFEDSDEIEDYCADNEIDPKDLRLVFCNPLYFQQVDTDYWSDVMSYEGEDEDLPDELLKALNAFNDVIAKLPPANYTPGNIRTEYKSI